MAQSSCTKYCVERNGHDLARQKQGRAGVIYHGRFAQARVPSRSAFTET